MFFKLMCSNFAWLPCFQADGKLCKCVSERERESWKRRKGKRKDEEKRGQGLKKETGVSVLNFCYDPFMCIMPNDPSD